MSKPAEIPFQQLLDALLNEDVPFHPRYLYRLSDLSQEDGKSLEKTWPRVSVWRRQALLEDLEELGETDFVLSFETIGRVALRDSDPQVRRTAVRLLWEYESMDLIPIFLKLLQADSDMEVRSDAATGLGKFVYMGEVDKLPERTRLQLEEELLRVVQEEYPPLLRRRALESLGYSGRQEIPPLIEKAYKLGKRDWLVSSLIAMGRSANNRWEKRVLPMLENSNTTVRVEAIRAAGELELAAARKPLLELLRDGDLDEDERVAAIWSLSQIGGQGVREALEELQEETDDDDEAEYLENALDNLAFTEDTGLFSLFNLPDDEVDADDETGLMDDEEEIED